MAFTIGSLLYGVASKLVTSVYVSSGSKAAAPAVAASDDDGDVESVSNPLGDLLTAEEGAALKAANAMLAADVVSLKAELQDARRQEMTAAVEDDDV